MSQIISRGFGGGAGIPQLILFRGLSPASLPPPPVPGISPEFRTILSGDVYRSFDSFSSLIFTDGVEFTLPPRSIEVTWQVIFGSVPAVANIVLQVSINGLDWVTIDTITNTAGDIKSIKTQAIFIRAAMLDMSEGIVTSVLIIARPTEEWEE